MQSTLNDCAAAPSRAPAPEQMLVTVVRHRRALLMPARIGGKLVRFRLHGDVGARSAVGASSTSYLMTGPNAMDYCAAEPAGRPDVGAVPERAERHGDHFRFSGRAPAPVKSPAFARFLHTPQ
jgi:hypothetical protein